MKNKDKESAIAELTKMIEEPIIITVKSVSRSGMIRKMDVYATAIGSDGKVSVNYINYLVSQALGIKRDKRYCLIIHGCGMDMVWNLAYEIGMVCGRNRAVEFIYI